MTDKEHKVAKAAIAAKPALNAVQLESDLSAQSGVGAMEVKDILGYLVREGLFKIAATPARNVAAGDPRQETRTMWYEKGDLWKDLAPGSWGIRAKDKEYTLHVDRTSDHYTYRVLGVNGQKVLDGGTVQESEGEDVQALIKRIQHILENRSVG
jgi:hypothetical protein